MTPDAAALWADLQHTAWNLRTIADIWRHNRCPTLAQKIDAAADEAQALSGQPVLPGVVRVEIREGAPG